MADVISFMLVQIIHMLFWLEFKKKMVTLDNHEIYILIYYYINITYFLIQTTNS